MSQAELARRLTRGLGRSIDRAAINKMLKGLRGVSADELLAIAEITGLPAPNEGSSIVQVPLLSWVSAGQLSDAGQQMPVEEAKYLGFANLGPGEFFALTVEGDSMDRFSPDGSTIVVNRADRELHHDKPYVFFHRTEGTTYKLWNADPPYLKPHSHAAHDPIFIKRSRDFQVVGRVRRTVLDL